MDDEEGEKTMNVIDRFLKYVAVDTESVEDAECFPQWYIPVWVGE